MELENAEACFYGEMGWVAGQVVKKDVIIKDFEKLDGDIKTAFVADVNQCASWSGDLSASRKRRAADDNVDDDDDVDYSQDTDGPGLLGWVKSLVRSKRALPGIL